MWVWLIFGTIAAAGAAFAVAPLLSARRARFAVPVIAIATAGAALGLYAMLGHPNLAARTFAVPEDEQLEALVADLAVKIRERPNELQGWLLLGRGYFALGIKAEAAKAMAEAVRLARAKNVPRAEFAVILSDYGVALAQASGAVTPAAELALRESVAADPKGMVARFYLGIAAAQRGDNQTAERLWESLLADMPADSPNRGDVVDRLAALKAQRGDTPDVRAMVDGLAARLAGHPNDLDGWRRLVRAYAVLGERDKAAAALAKARTQFRRDRRAVAALRETARENTLAWK